MKFVAVLGPTTASYLASFMGGCRTGIGRLRNVQVSPAAGVLPVGDRLAWLGQEDSNSRMSL